MPALVVVKMLEGEMEPPLIAEFEVAVKTAWDQFVSQRPDWTNKAMTFWLGLQRSQETLVAVSVGAEAKFGQVRGATSGEVRTNLLQHLLARFPR
jgi:hypothetical protein